MLIETKRRALRAAQQVSFVAIAACGSQAAVTQPSAENPGSSTQDAALADAAMIDAAAFDAPADHPLTDAVPDTKLACTEFEAGIRADGGANTALGDAQQCRREYFGKGKFDWTDPLMQYCCYEAQLAPTEKPLDCTPWGPPTPPAMV